MYDENMSNEGNLTKFLVGGLCLLIIGSGLFFWRLSQGSNKSPGPLELPISTDGLISTQSANLSEAERVRNLELAVAGIVAQIKSSSTTPSSSTPVTAESRLKLLETTVADLQARVKTLEITKNITVTPTTTTTSKPSTYIPLGWSGTTTSSDWTSITSSEMSFNPNDFSGITSINFGATIKTSSSGGRAYVRIYNQTDNSVVSTSETSTDATVYTGALSGKFNLPSGRKTYYLQIKSTDNYQALVQDAWISVNY